MTSNRRISRCPIFEVFPSFCLPPVEYCRGTRPIQAAKSRPRRNCSIGGAKVSTASAVIGPTPVQLARHFRFVRHGRDPCFQCIDPVGQVGDLLEEHPADVARQIRDASVKIF